LNKYIKCNFRGQRCGTTPIGVVSCQRVKNVPHCWGGSVPKTVLILQISVCDYDLIPVLMQPLPGNDLQTDNTF